MRIHLSVAAVLAVLVAVFSAGGLHTYQPSPIDVLSERAVGAIDAGGDVDRDEDHHPAKAGIDQAEEFQVQTIVVAFDVTARRMRHGISKVKIKAGPICRCERPPRDMATS